MTEPTGIPDENAAQAASGPHAEEEVTLRCNRCGKPITARDAVLTPTGYRCKECVRGQQKAFDTTQRLDVVFGFLISAVITFAGSWLVPRLGFITLLVAPGVGLLIHNAVRAAVNRRRGRTLNQAVLWGSIIGALPLVIITLIPLLTTSGNIVLSLNSALPLIWQVVYSVMTASSAYAQAGGIRVK